MLIHFSNQPFQITLNPFDRLAVPNKRKEPLISFPSKEAIQIRFQFVQMVPHQFVMPIVTVSQRSVVSRKAMQDIPITVASSIIPPTEFQIT